MRGNGGNHHDKLGLQRIACASQFTITDMACTSPDLVCDTFDTQSSQPNQASRSPDFSDSLVSSHDSHLHPASHSFASTTLPSSQNTNLSHPSLSLHVMIMS
jgi:hypothetical protein